MNKKHRCLALLYMALAVAVGITSGPLAGIMALFALSTAFAFQIKPNPYALGAYEITAPTTGTTLATMAPDAVRRLWDKGINTYEQSSDFFTEMEGGANSIIWEKTDLAAGDGSKITFTVGSGLYDEPHIGEEVFETQDDYEAFLIDTHDLFVDFARHGTRKSVRADEIMGMRQEIETGYNTEMGKWLGRLKSEQLFMMFKAQLPTENVVFAGGKAQNTLVAADVLDWDEIIALGVQMKGKGGQPAKVGTMQNGQPVFRNTIVATTDALFSLDQDTNYKQVLRETNNPRFGDLLFNGGYAAPKGHLIAEYTPIDHDGEGATGSPLNPQARLGVAIVAGTAAIDITGGGNPTSAAKTKKKYFKYFPNYAYRFIGNTDASAGGVTTLAQDAETHYCLIVNPPNAATDPNKIGMYAYTTGNNGNKITVTARLGAGAGGVKATTLGDVTWNTGVWSGKHTEVHPVGALVLPCNSKGQVFGDSLMLGRRAAYRGYGMWRNKRMQDQKEGGFIKEMYIASVFGQALRKDRLDRVPAVMRIRHAINYAGLPLPVVV